MVDGETEKVYYEAATVWENLKKLERFSHLRFEHGNSHPYANQFYISL